MIATTWYSTPFQLGTLTCPRHAFSNFDHPAKFADQRSMLIVKANDVVVYTSICVTAEGFELLHRAAVRAMQPGSASTQSLAEAEVVASSKKLQLKVSWLESQVVEQK